MEDCWARLYDAVWATREDLGILLGMITGALVIKYGWLKAFLFHTLCWRRLLSGERVDNKESLAELVQRIFPCGQGEVRTSGHEQRLARELTFKILLQIDL